MGIDDNLDHDLVVSSPASAMNDNGTGTDVIQSSYHSEPSPRRRGRQTSDSSDTTLGIFEDDDWHARLSKRATARLPSTPTTLTPVERSNSHRTSITCRQNSFISEDDQSPIAGLRRAILLAKEVGRIAAMTNRLHVAGDSAEISIDARAAREETNAFDVVSVDEHNNDANKSESSAGRASRG